MKWRFVEHVTKRTFDAYAPEREGCSRPMRVEVRRLHRLTHREQCCCEQCFRAVYRRRNNARRRVVPEPRACIVCGTVFTPRKSNATTCSGTSAASRRCAGFGIPWTRKGHQGASNGASQL
jgi:hypothetical protein